MSIIYSREAVSVEEFADILSRSGLGERRPVNDLPRLNRMLDGANLIITARDDKTNEIVGIARSLTDWSYACYLSDLAVDKAYQGMGIGRTLIQKTHAEAGEESMCLLVSSPDSVAFYERIGMPRSDRAFLYPRSR